MNKDQTRSRLTLILPAYNEETLIGSSLDELIKQVSSHHLEADLIVVDDGSLDRTSQIVSEYKTRYPQISLLRNDRNRGKGYSVRRAVLQSSAGVIIFIDADLPYDFESIKRIYDTICAGAQLAIGSRIHPESASKKRIPLMRFLSGKVFNFLIQLFLISGIPDTQCGLKGFREKEAHEIFKRTTIDGFGFDVEVLYLARRLGYIIQPVPVKLVFSRIDSRVRLLEDSIRMLFDLFKIRYTDFRGKYSIE
jgi:dolichyl-phosphate beta-glucosyltransferase